MCRISTTGLAVMLALSLVCAVQANEDSYRHDSKESTKGGTKASKSDKADKKDWQGKGVNVNDMAPEFTAAMHPSGDFNLADHRGHTVVLYFYPADDTPICTEQAAAFRDRLDEFEELDAMIFGISPDSMESHGMFAEEHNLPFGLLVDDGGSIRDQYGMPRGHNAWEQRATYVIDGDGKVRHIIVHADDIDKHINESLNWARRLNAESRS